ncbi:MAG: ribosomal protein S18-alanine N-acetyltransferase [Actinomycetota bacterium]
MTVTVELQPLVEDDLDAVHRLEVDSSPDPWSRDLLAGELDGDGNDRLWLVAAAGRGPRRRIVGFGGVLLVVDEAHVMNLVVSAGQRRRRVASRLLASLLLAAADRGATAATLEVRAGNDAAIELYRRFGFEMAGRRPRYYADGADAEIMWCHGLYRPDVRSRLRTLGGLE